MARYIDADKLRNRVKIQTNPYGKPTLEYASGLKVLVMIDQEPTADVVEVVRCKDCKWYQESEILAPNKFCFRLKHPVEDRQIGYNFSPDAFCSYGERKEK